MRKIVFVWQKDHGEHNKVKETFEFEDNTTDEEISKEYETWVWEQIGDYFTWYEE